MIKEIELKGIATYDKNGTSLKNLQKINFIYGANGSGKTTVSNYLLNFSDGKYQQCGIQWRNDNSLEMMVYNKDFKEKNFNSSNLIKGVFTLGEATDDDIRELSEKKEQLNTIKEQGVDLKTSLEKLNGKDETKGDLQKLDDEFKEFCWLKIYKKYEENFKEAFKGSMQKQSFKAKVLDESAKNKVSLLSIDELKEKSKTIFGEIPQNLNSILNIKFKELNTIEDSEIWNKKIIGKSDVDIAKLIQILNINDWVNQGKEYIQDSNTCPFCQQETITDDFKKQIEKYFDITFTESIKSIKQYKQQYDFTSETIKNQLNLIELEQTNNKNTKLDIEKFSIYFKTLMSQLHANKENLNNKIKEPSRSVEFISTKETFENIYFLINKANEEILKHNKIVENYQTEKSLLISSIWKFLVYNFDENIKDYSIKYQGFQKGIENLTIQHQQKQQEYIKLNSEIKELGKNVTSVQPTIDEINDTLKYYGFSNFKIVPSQLDKNQYQIKREDGTLAQETLSEGEITFITFLYYYQLTKGAITQDEVSNDRVLIIDDPISSLDSNILFVVSTLIKKTIEDIKINKGNIKQLILLTHNVYFHKEVSFINSRDTDGRSDTFFWILRKNNNISLFQEYEIKNPIQTSYQLLWQEVKNKENNSITTIQNTMRRIIENYFKILGNYKDDTLIQKFDTFEEQIICKSLISWINDGSHSVSDDLYIESQTDSVDRYLEVFEKIFYHTGHNGHYRMMMDVPNKYVKQKKANQK